MTVHELRRPAEIVCVLVTRDGGGFAASLDDAAGLDGELDADEVRAPTLEVLGARIAKRLKEHWRIK